MEEDDDDDDDNNSVTVIPLEILYSKFLILYFVPLRTKQAQRGRRYIALSILDAGTRREGVISPKSAPLYSRNRNP